MTSTAERLAKRIVDYPEDSVPVVSVKGWMRNLTRDPKQDAIDYAKSLFPIAGWITRYNLTWFIGDLIAGITVGMVLVPQSMSYATIATLKPEFGLYSSFVGVLTYCFFATSKDVSIGPVAVMSLTVAQIIKHVEHSHGTEWPREQIATTIAFVCGFIVLGIGLLRIGWLVEFIPAPAVSGFMTGSAINIVAGQVPGLMGITGFDTRAETYRVIINTLKGLPRTKLDAAFGLTGLTCLYLIRYACEWATKKWPRRARVFFFISVLRNAFVILVLTIAAWLFTRHRKDAKGKYPIKILGSVPRGFKHMGQPKLDSNLISALAGQLPVATIILLLEHIAISKSFGRVNGYKINPNQELIAIGVTNTIGTLFGAYPATGSFSRSALKSKSGVRTPLAGVYTAIVVLVALYGLTPAFYWIPSSALSALIIHAVADLVASPPQVFRYWRISPLEFFIWAAAVLVTIFSTIENGIYTSVAASLALLLIRIARPRGNFLGRLSRRGGAGERDVYVPLSPNGVINDNLPIDAMQPGMVVYRFEESFLYPNSSLVNSAIVDWVKENTRRGKAQDSVKIGDRPWNDPGPRSGVAFDDLNEDRNKPILRAVVLDFSGINNIDTTGVQSLVDTRNEVERWADGPVEFHFATILSPWISRALIAGGFGTGQPAAHNAQSDITSVVPFPEGYADQELAQATSHGDIESAAVPRGESHNMPPKRPAPLDTLVSRDTPFFHFDLESAVRAAEYAARAPSRTSSISGSVVKA